jgi:hypothetical protein
MDRQVPIRSREFSLGELDDARDLRSMIAAALAATPVDGESLRRGVWTYVGAERELGTSPGHVIVSLTELVECSSIVPISIQRAVMRRVILWCVDAYFGRIGPEFVDGGDDVPNRRGVRSSARARGEPMKTGLDFQD